MTDTTGFPASGGGGGSRKLLLAAVAAVLSIVVIVLAVVYITGRKVGIITSVCCGPGSASGIPSDYQRRQGQRRFERKPPRMQEPHRMRRREGQSGCGRRGGEGQV